MTSSWERRLDNDNRVYYVDHNTRSTTWQRPNANMLNNVSLWQEWRSARNNNMQEAFAQLYGADNALLPLNGDLPKDNDQLGSLPKGWGTHDERHSLHIDPIVGIRTENRLELSGLLCQSREPHDSMGRPAVSRSPIAGGMGNPLQCRREAVFHRP